MFTIHDTGPGLSAANLSRMFEKRWRAEDSAEKGHGLGLFISKRLVEALGGTIWCELPAQGGTAVSFTLPRSSTEPSHLGGTRRCEPVARAILPSRPRPAGGAR